MTLSDGTKHLCSPQDCKAHLVQQVSTVPGQAELLLDGRKQMQTQGSQDGQPFQAVHMLPSIELLAQIYQRRRIRTIPRNQITPSVFSLIK